MSNRSTRALRGQTRRFYTRAIVGAAERSFPVLVLLAVMGASSACISTGTTTGSHPGTGAGDGGLVEDDAAGTEGRDAPSAAGDGSCSPTPSGCFCIAGDSDPGPLASCNTSSVVKAAGEQGVCCDGTVLCACDVYSCRNDPTSQFCQCSTSFTASTAVAGAIVTECPAPTASQHCCLSGANNTCICSTLDCDPGTTGVPTCSLARVAVCAADALPLSACR